jgi:signal transduction histidine kinase
VAAISLYPLANRRRCFLGRLVNAQEAECRRIARELHDNITQSLVLQFVDGQWLDDKIGERQKHA